MFIKIFRIKNSQKINKIILDKRLCGFLVRLEAWRVNSMIDLILIYLFYYFF